MAKRILDFEELENGEYILQLNMKEDLELMVLIKQEIFRLEEWLKENRGKANSDSTLIGITEEKHETLKKLFEDLYSKGEEHIKRE